MSAGQKRVSVCAHPSEFILEEMEARGWDARAVAERMGGPADVAECELDLYLHVHDPRVILGETAERLGKAFDVDPQFFRNLHASWVGFIKDAAGVSTLEAEVTRLRTALGEAVEALQSEEDVQAAALGCDECDGGEYCEVHIEQAITSAEKRRAALAAARAVGEK